MRVGRFTALNYDEKVPAGVVLRSLIRAQILVCKISPHRNRNRNRNRMAVQVHGIKYCGKKYKYMHDKYRHTKEFALKNMHVYRTKYRHTYIHVKSLELFPLHYIHTYIYIYIYIYRYIDTYTNVNLWNYFNFIFIHIHIHIYIHVKSLELFPLCCIHTHTHTHTYI